MYVMVAKNTNCSHCFKPFASTFQQRKAFMLERFNFEIEAKRALTEAAQNNAQPNEVPRRSTRIISVLVVWMGDSAIHDGENHTVQFLELCII